MSLGENPGKKIKQQDVENISVRLTRTAEEIEAAQRLRYQVFYEEYGAKPSQEMARARLDFDDYDAFADHLVVTDRSNGKEKIVGTYRLLQEASANRYGKFYSSSEFDLTPLINADASLLELGRSCVLPEYRTRPVLQLLWEGIANFITQNNIEIMFGCASLHSTDIKSIAAPLSYLHHYHLAKEEYRVRALKGQYINMDLIPKEELNPRRTLAELPPLIKGYLRVGAMIGDGAVIDEQFNTTDVCIIVETKNMPARYRNHYERKMGKAMPGKIEDIKDIQTFASETI